jgi:hypothetical protein
MHANSMQSRFCRQSWHLHCAWLRVDNLARCVLQAMALVVIPFQNADFLLSCRLQELGPIRGGILADEMGMGKTIQAISLMMSHRADGDTPRILTAAEAAAAAAAAASPSKPAAAAAAAGTSGRQAGLKISLRKGSSAAAAGGGDAAAAADAANEEQQEDSQAQDESAAAAVPAGSPKPAAMPAAAAAAAGSPTPALTPAVAALAKHGSCCHKGGPKSKGKGKDAAAAAEAGGEAGAACHKAQQEAEDAKGYCK